MSGEQAVIEVLKKAGAFSGDQGITIENIANDPSVQGFGSIDLTMKIIDSLYDQGIIDAVDGPDGKELWFLTGRKAVAKRRLTAIIKTKRVKSGQIHS